MDQECFRGTTGLSYQTKHAENSENIEKPLISLADAQSIVDQSVRQYFSERREHIPKFTEKHFSWKGAWSLNKKAFGHDVYRAPVNIVAMLPTMGLRAAAHGFDRAGRNATAAKLRNTRLHMKTDVAEELEWLIYTDLLEIPFSQSGRHSTQDAVAEAIYSHPKMNQALDQVVSNIVDAAGPRNRAQLEDLMATYLETRAANAEVVNLAICLVAGAALAHKVTPGILSLGPAISGAVANKAAMASFPMGAAVGGLWYNAFPIAPSAALAVGTTGGLLAATSLFAAFSGLISDPVQQALGFHQKRLEGFVDTLEQNIMHDEDNRLKMRDHYVARIIDLFDALSAILAHVR